MRYVRLLCAAVLFSTLVVSQGRGAPPITQLRAPNAALETVELFAAMSAGQLNVRYIPDDEKQARVLFENTTGAALNVQLPEYFAAVPILAQFNGPIFNPRGGQPPQQTNSAMQSVTGPFSGLPGPNGPGQNNQNQGNNFFQQFNIPVEGLEPSQMANRRSGGTGFIVSFCFSIPAERIVELRVGSFCLEQGKDNPRPSTTYKLVPLEQLIENADTMKYVMREWAAGKCTQATAQAAVWHLSPLSDTLSWNELAQIPGELTTLGRRPYFTRGELVQARQVVERADTAVPEQKKSTLDSFSTIRAKVAPR